MSEARRRKSEVERQKMEDGSRESGVERQKSEDGRRKSEVGSHMIGDLKDLP